ncbi:sigma-70 family RNA polymerase sigma factor [Hazenella sp. IB182357]|uniref:Sigma-70 family RNA polymerase sigma factor n=1 Tax=Polycladospora coralii TaxID=2771432 RepID=A0A926N9M3_9BACL|nr:sigma-70 family RNA polymerase sigma factor [Polycladospora coralii]MBD1372278.1 sigma-70 family RNA polymerase sigma factor [Polycladospora coralii]MBS7531532.1 sigma-70 family RNA polymerase sigma factor [Polycladospora coralii]
MSSNEANFIERLQRQEEDALAYIVDHYLGLIKGIVYKTLSSLNNKGMIEECINDVLLSVWNNGKKFSGETTDFKKWICAIAKFKSIDYYRKACRNTEQSSDAIDMKSNHTVELEIIRMENHFELVQLINQLPKLDRDIFIMRFFWGMRTEDIANQLNVTKSSVDNRIYRGKKKLSQQAQKLQVGVNVI